MKHPTVASYRLVAASTLILVIGTLACRQDRVTHARLLKASPPSAPAAMPPEPGQGEQLRWTLPKGWTEAKGEGMRYATLQPGGAGKAEVSVIMLAGASGGELANVNRWRGQLGLPPVDEAALPPLRTEVKSSAGGVALYDFTSDGQTKSRMVVGLLAKPDSSWFIKLNGDAAAVGAVRADFVTLLGTLHLD